MEKNYLLDSSTKMLIISNLIVIVLAVWQQWNLFLVIWIYWFQNIIIGFFNFLRILSLKDFSTERFKIGNRNVNPTKSTKIFVAFFFLFHYGMFTFVHGVFVFLLVISSFFTISSAISLIDFALIPLAILIFFINHLFSFIKNKEEDKKKKRNIGLMMFLPYARIFPMHLILILGLGAIMSGFSSTIILVFFLLMKTVADVIMHIIEHTGFNYSKSAKKY